MTKRFSSETLAPSASSVVSEAVPEAVSTAESLEYFSTEYSSSAEEFKRVVVVVAAFSSESSNASSTPRASHIDWDERLTCASPTNVRTFVAGSGATSGVVSERRRRDESSGDALSSPRMRGGFWSNSLFFSLVASFFRVGFGDFESRAPCSISARVSGASVNRSVPASNIRFTGNGLDSDDHCVCSFCAEGGGQREARVTERNSRNRSLLSVPEKI